ncbi:MAG: hypothetical protein Q8M29_02865 [Bacteroidota bacterium]|nr:hypothetical protein [Bacteroidota bacterium]
MGCAPNPEEVEMGRSGSKNSEAKSLMEKFSKNTDHFFEILQQLKDDFKDHTVLLKKLNTSFSGIKKPSAYIEAEPNEGPPDNFYYFLSELRRVAEGNYSRAKEMERVFCDLHAKFYPIYDAYPEVLNSRAKEGVQLAITNYIEHRKDDVNTWIAWLNKERGFSESALKYGAEDSPEKAKALIEKIDAEIKRVQNLSEKDILLDNTLFARNSDEFDSTENIYKD